jgi:D-3-phosphoglycerate dehydrogenase
VWELKFIRGLSNYSAKNGLVFALWKRFKVLISAQMHQDGIDLLEKEATVIFPSKPLNLLAAEDFIITCKDCDALVAITNVEQISRDVIAGLPKLKIIARHGVGYDNVDVKAASERGIYVTTAPVLEETVADQAFALLLCLARNTCKANAYVISRKWTIRDPYKFMGTDVHGKIAGIVGLGRIGAGIAERAKGFKMTVLYFDVVHKLELEKQLGLKFRQFSDLLGESDFVFITCPLNAETRGLIGKKEFALMKPSAFLINVARGPIVSHDALVETLREKRIAGAGLDVHDREPFPLDDPLLDLDNVVLTPHLSANTIECRRRMAITVAEEVRRVLHGEKPRYAVNTDINSK